MNPTLTLRRPVPVRLAHLLMACALFWLASAASLAPTLTHVAIHASAPTHAQVCHCAHCSGGPTCCCLNGTKCLTK